MSDSFNLKYRAWKEAMVTLINEGGIPLAVVSDFLAAVKAEIDRVVALEEQAEKEHQSAQQNMV